MICDKTLANAVGGKTARACDSCIWKRARWYCAADDAFLCQACDSSVHSANPLARRHERVRLKTASLKYLDLASKENSASSWHRGFTRKARSPRHGKALPYSKSDQEVIRNPIPIVPEVGSDEISHEDNEEEQLLYRVPVYDPFVAELCTSTTISSEAEATTPGNYVDHQTGGDANGIESKGMLAAACRPDAENLCGFLPSDTDLAEFAANAESLLGKGLENESFGMEELGLMKCKEEDELHRESYTRSIVRVKLEEEEEEVGRDCQGGADGEINMAREPPSELSFDYDSPATCGEEDEKMVTEKRDSKSSEEDEDGDDGAKKKKRKIILRLDYEAVISAWASQGSPWTTGHGPDFDPGECWPDCMGGCGIQLHQSYIETSGVLGQSAMADGGREARVSRYRKKLRTRLFSKKIRYEVRKLNAEKRPTMKGRFVKRATFAGPPFPILNTK